MMITEAEKLWRDKPDTDIYDGVLKCQAILETYSHVYSKELIEWVKFTQKFLTKVLNERQRIH